MEYFIEDELYKYIFPEKQVRKKALVVFFKAYMDLWGEYGEIIATSPNLEGLAYIYDDALFAGQFKNKIDEWWYQIKTLRMLRYISMDEWCYFHRTLSHMSSDWISDHVQGPFIHLDLIGVHKNHRGKGLAKGMIQYAKNEAREKAIPLILETQNPKNCDLYTHLGFDTCEIYEYKRLTQYCMVYNWKATNK